MKNKIIKMFDWFISDKQINTKHGVVYIERKPYIITQSTKLNEL